ncbi:MAG: Mth938-like domain-containing protein [Alphaproteobacteria bacterium]
MAESRIRSPRITHVSWGRMEVEGIGSGKDFKLFPGGGRAWNWNETGTRHVPGIQPGDVVELLDRGSDVIVLTRGMELALETCPATLEMLRERGIPVHVEETRAAVALYNELAEEHAVGGLFHSTC